MAVDVEAFKEKPAPPEPASVELSVEEAKGYLEGRIRRAIVNREKEELFFIGHDRTSFLTRNGYLEKRLMQAVGLEVMSQFGLDPDNPVTYEDSERPSIDQTVVKIRTYKVENERYSPFHPFRFIRTIGHTSTGEQAFVHWYADGRI